MMKLFKRKPKDPADEVPGKVSEPVEPEGRGSAPRLKPLMMKLFKRKPKDPAGEVPEKVSEPVGPEERSYCFQLELRFRDKLIVTESTENLDGELTIGKAPDNGWHLPENDRTGGAHHARLQFLAGGIRITACEGHTLYIHGKQVSECMLRRNDRVAVGDSELYVKPSSAKAPCDVHRLEILSGEHAGEMIRLEKAVFRIGSGEGNDLVLDSDVVSHRHAELRIAENGESWIRDLHSSNGTLVNGERLGSQERMLMDSDEISIAHVDYRFLDRNVVHTRTHFGRKMLVMGCTVLLVLAGFGVFYALSPSAEMVINAVEFYLLRNDFDAAERVLSRMPDSRGFQRYEQEYYDYRASIPRYRGSYEAEQEFQQFIADSRWNDAEEGFGKLKIDDPESWNQADPGTEGRIREIRTAKRLLDTLLTLRDLNSSTDTSPQFLYREWQKFRPLAAELERGGDVPKYRAPLVEALKVRLNELDHNIALIKEVHARLDELSGDVSERKVGELRRFIAENQGRVSGVVRVYFRDLSSLLDRIAADIRHLRDNDRALFDLRVDDVRPLEMIPWDDCVKVPQLFAFRKKMEEHHLRQLRSRDHWKGLHRQLSRYDLNLQSIPEEIAAFCDAKRIEEVLELKNIASPVRGQITEYERFFGEKYFYEVIQQSVHTTNNIYASDLIPNMRIIPKIVLLKDLYRGINETLAWFGLPENQWLLHGKMKETRDSYVQLLATREKVLAVLESVALRNRGSRKYFIAGAAYFFIAPSSKDIPKRMLSFAREWRQFRLDQQAMLARFDLMDLKKSQEVRKAIIDNGIPGDPVFNWVRSLP